jgi:nucleoside triphosphate pyrophosphatase
VKPARIVLASSSPRRRAILESLRLSFDVVHTDSDESIFPGESAYDAAERLARLKASAVNADGALVIAADTIVVLDGEAINKPADREDARRMLRALSGRRHDVVTGVALVREGRVVSGREVCGVLFAPMSEEEIARYAATGEPDDKAGAYALQGIGGLFVSAVEGSPSNVVGLPLTLLYKLAREIGVDLL